MVGFGGCLGAYEFCFVLGLLLIVCLFCLVFVWVCVCVGVVVGLAVFNVSIVSLVFCLYYEVVRVGCLVVGGVVVVMLVGVGVGVTFVCFIWICV